MSRSFRSLYVNRAKYPHRKPAPEAEGVQAGLFEPTDFTGNCPNCRLGSVPSMIAGKLVHVSKKANSQDCWNQSPAPAAAPLARTPKPTPTPVISTEPLPKRIYESNGHIFGLHDGGQEFHHVEIKWRYLKPVSVKRVDQ